MTFLNRERENILFVVFSPLVCQGETQVVGIAKIAPIQSYHIALISKYHKFDLFN